MNLSKYTNRELLDADYSFLYKLSVKMPSGERQYAVGIHTRGHYAVLKAFSKDDMLRRIHTLLEVSLYLMGSEQEHQIELNALAKERFKPTAKQRKINRQKLVEVA